MQNINALIMPWFCVIGVTIVYAALVRWLFRGRLDVRLAWAGFAGSTAIAILCIASFFVGSMDHIFSPALLNDLQAAATFGKMFKLALVYAAIPDDAAVDTSGLDFSAGNRIDLFELGRRRAEMDVAWTAPAVPEAAPPIVTAPAASPSAGRR